MSQFLFVKRPGTAQLYFLLKIFQVSCQDVNWAAFLFGGLVMKKFTSRLKVVGRIHFLMPQLLKMGPLQRQLTACCLLLQAQEEPMPSQKGFP